MMKKLSLIVIGACLFSATAMAQTKKPATSTKTKKTSTTTGAKPKTTSKPMSNSNFTIETEAQRISYALGVNIASNIKTQGFDNIDAKAIAQAFADVQSKKSSDWLISVEASNQILQEFVQKQQGAKGEANLKAGQAFLEENKKRAGVITLPSGLQYEVITAGTGEKPLATSTVTTHYHGTLIDGTVFDSSVQRGQPAQFPVNGVIAGWTEALQLMPVGSKWKLYLPSNLAYGERGAGGQIGPNAALIFEVELISIDK
ncbi:MAG: hypothetical protein RLZZ175_124 [Bacteroidota bacterium]|jgi:FKBP-type peptidyl-prolyl cis-trans isomerase FklB